MSGFTFKRSWAWAAIGAAIVLAYSAVWFWRFDRKKLSEDPKNEAEPAAPNPLKNAPKASLPEKQQKIQPRQFNKTNSADPSKVRGVNFPSLRPSRNLDEVPEPILPFGQPPLIIPAEDDSCAPAKPEPCAPAEKKELPKPTAPPFKK